MFIARKRASTTDERSRSVDTQDPFPASEVPVGGAMLNPLVASLGSTAVGGTVAVLDTSSVGYGSFVARDMSDHYRFSAKPGQTYTLVVSTDSSNGNIRTNAFADYFDLYFEDGTGSRLTAGFQVKELDLRTKLVEYTVPGTGTAEVPLYVQIDNALGQPFEYAVALFQKSAAPRIQTQVTELANGTFRVVFESDQVLFNARPRVDRITVEGGVLGSLVRSADGRSYSGVFTPKVPGEAGTIQALTGSFFNVAGDPNLDGDEADNAARLLVDQEAPTVLGLNLVGPGLGLDADAASPYLLTVQFSEAVRQFGLDDLTVVGGVATAIRGSGSRYEVDIQRNNESREIVVTVKAGGYTDVSPKANPSTKEAQVVFQPDLEAPNSALFSAKAELQPGERARVELSFTERVLGLTEAQLEVLGGAVVEGSLRALDATGMRWAFDIEADDDEVLTPDVVVQLRNFEAITDKAGNAVLPPMTLTFAGSMFYVPEAATADDRGVTFRAVVRTDHTDLRMLLQDEDEQTPDIELGLASAGADPLTLPLVALDLPASGRLVVENGVATRGLGLRLSLGSDSGDELAVGDADDQGEPMVIYGFGGDDILREGTGQSTLLGGDGVDRYELTPGVDSTVVIFETGAPLTRVLGGTSSVIGAVPVVGDLFTGFDLVLGFDAADGGDQLHFLRTEDTVLQTVRGVYDPDSGVFAVDAGGADVMLFTDRDGGTLGRPDPGEPAVVVVGAAAVMADLGG